MKIALALEWKPCPATRAQGERYRAETPIGTVTVAAFKGRAGNGWRAYLPDGRHGLGFDTAHDAMTDAERLIDAEMQQSARD